MSPFIELLKSVQQENQVCMDEEWTFCQYLEKYYALALGKWCKYVTECKITMSCNNNIPH